MPFLPNSNCRKTYMHAYIHTVMAAKGRVTSWPDAFCVQYCCRVNEKVFVALFFSEVSLSLWRSTTAGGSSCSWLLCSGGLVCCRSYSRPYLYIPFFLKGRLHNTSQFYAKYWFLTTFFNVCWLTCSVFTSASMILILWSNSDSLIFYDHQTPFKSLYCLCFSFTARLCTSVIGQTQLAHLLY